MTDKEKNESIEFILAQGFVEPITFRERVLKMFDVLGWRFIFWDLSYSLIFASVTFAGITVLLRYTPMDYQHSFALGLSPMLFLIIMLFAEITERTCGLYEIKQTCRYTSRQITALRCMFYSAAGAVFAIIVAAFCTEGILHFFKLLPLCLGGLFFCATIELSVIRLIRSNWAMIVFPVVWVVTNIMLPFTLKENWEQFISGLPVVFTITFLVLGAVTFMYQTNKMLTEENNYAFA